jgi:hypothetical protein
MSITKKIEEKFLSDPIFAELYEQHESAKFNRQFLKTNSWAEISQSFLNDKVKTNKRSYNKLHTV